MSSNGATRTAERLPVAPSDADWRDWKWQQRNAVRSSDAAREVFPELREADALAIDEHSAAMRFQVTRYYLSLVERLPDAAAPRPDDPLWLQVLPTGTEAVADDSYRYDGTENWELPHEMVTPIAQRKYDDRVIVRLANVCHSYCQFCYEALRTLERESEKAAFAAAHWEDTLDYLRAHRDVEEVILSGGEPLIQSDAQLARVFADLRSLGRPLAIRVHTRALTFNPFRITDPLVALMAEHEVNAVGVHVSHPRELTPEFAAGARRLQKAVPVLFANIPLLRGVNDSTETIRELGTRLYQLGVARGYLYHFMPHSPSSARFRTPVERGVEIVRALKRRVSNLAVPEYVLPHHTGKHTVPLLGPGEEAPRRATNAAGEQVFRYVNWLGEPVEYPDPPVG